MVNLATKIRRIIRSPYLTTLWALLATLSAATSFTAFLAGGLTTTSEIVLAPILGLLLSAAHITLLFAGPTIRAHPRVRFHDSDSILLVIYMPTLAVSFALSRAYSSTHEIYSAVSTAAFSADVVFTILCLLPRKWTALVVFDGSWMWAVVAFGLWILNRKLNRVWLCITIGVCHLVRSFLIWVYAEPVGPLGDPVFPKDMIFF